MAFSDIDRASVISAIEEFDTIGRDRFLEKYGFGASRSYFLLHSGRQYDSKAIVGAAHGRLAGEKGPLSADDFSGGEATVARILRSLGFTVNAAAPAGSAQNTAANARQFWWVNNKQTFSHEISGNYLWSPVTKSNGGHSVFYDNMKRVRPGDIIFAFADARIRAVGVCEATTLLLPKPEEFGAAGGAWGNEGWKLPVRFTLIPSPIRPKDHMDVLGPLLPKKYSPIQANGDGNQGAYLAEVSQEMADAIVTLLGKQWADLNLLNPSLIVSNEFAQEETEASAAAAIKNRTDIGETQKLQLVQSRRGQGIYRKNLEGFERACRLTGVSDLAHLRASHIKPWRASTDFEKLDGNNGLLLSPHVDHLFDRGYISATEDGQLLISYSLDPDTLARWGIDPMASLGTFRPEQRPYLLFHRKFVFQG